MAEPGGGGQVSSQRELNLGAGAVPSRSAGLSECAECGGAYAPNRRAGSYQRYCGDACRTKAWKREHPEGPATMTRSERIVARLRLGRATGLELLRAGGGTRYSARISELREAGVRILGPRRWWRPDGVLEEETVPRTPDGHDQYEIREGE